MKKSILVLIIGVAGLTTAKAQMTKGNLFIGTGLGAATYSTGNYNFNYSDGNAKGQDAKDFSLSLSPQMGVFLTDHLVFGGTLNLAYDHTKNNITNTSDGALVNNTTVNATTFAVGPFLRYYFYNSPESKTVFYLQGDAAAGTGGGSTTQSIVNENGSSTYSNGSNSIETPWLVPVTCMEPGFNVNCPDVAGTRFCAIGSSVTTIFLGSKSLRDKMRMVSLAWPDAMTCCGEYWPIFGASTSTK